ncbi:MAG: hypothetical protein UV41_C0053G0010 [Candidatus Daviesbacteria bacterium GW2011_GWA2_42_7]|uniref:Uncharacterized protein n=2 Tax=Microgenomates group TaxID=1794810 RepID=A0A1F5HXA0_9BACT|nr:MAG: hypothetical protein UV41_C0053G0010 [Candidatus Daviesbacteria bacterium GW2011_GWA2_42_7]OGE08777.1 MAG: hypothetical protein A3A60_00395 [Candidatus Curtissbacteria bacterium RIFCSPLOWO2_01_FULL_42_26]
MNTLFFAALIDGSGLPRAQANSTTLKTIFLIAFAIIGALAFLFMVIAGARYALSKGEPDNIQRAKNEMKYSAIGLIIAALAAAIVNFVLGKL